MQKIGQSSIISMLAFSYLSKSHNNIYCLSILCVVGPEFLCRRVEAVTILLRVGSRMRTYFSWGQICEASTHYFLSLYIKIHKIKKCPKVLCLYCGKINKMAINYIKEYSLKLDWLFLYLNFLLILQIVVQACCSNLYSHPLYLRECIAHLLLPNFFIFTSLIKMSCFYFNIFCGVFSIFLDWLLRRNYWGRRD